MCEIFTVRVVHRQVHVPEFEDKNIYIKFIFYLQATQMYFLLL